MGERPVLACQSSSRCRVGSSRTARHDAQVSLNEGLFDRPTSQIRF